MLEDKIIDIVKDVSKKSEVKSTDTLGSLGIDSLDKIDILSSLEDEFGVTVNENELYMCESLEDVINCVRTSLHAPDSRL